MIIILKDVMYYLWEDFMKNHKKNLFTFFHVIWEIQKKLVKIRFSIHKSTTYKRNIQNQITLYHSPNPHSPYYINSCQTFSSPSDKTTLTTYCLHIPTHTPPVIRKQIKKNIQKTTATTWRKPLDVISLSHSWATKETTNAARALLFVA